MEVDKLLKLDERIGRRVNAVRPRVAGYGHDDVIALASNRRKGSVPRKLNRPTFSPPMTLSNRKDGAPRSIGRRPRRVSDHHRSTGGKLGRRG